MKISKKHIRDIIREFNDAGDISGGKRVDYPDEEDLKINPYGTGNREAEPENHAIGHTWLTHVKIQDESLKEINGIIGDPILEVLHHDLQLDGSITYYDIKFGNKVITSVPARMVEAVKQQEHSH